MNIVLTGYRCSGKTTVGKILAGNLERRLLDTDRMIEKKVGNSIARFVASNGWETFRNLEREVVAEISLQDNQVISTGGGVIALPENVRNLRRNGWIAWLRTTPETILRRMQEQEGSDHARPSLTGRGALNEIEEVLTERREGYAEAADYGVNTDGRSPMEVAEAILRKLRLKPVEE